MTDLSGKKLGRYQIMEPLGQGGMAAVYKAGDTLLERDVAIKIIRRDAFPPEILHDVLKRFEREAKSLARLSHPNIVKVLDYGEYEGSPYLVLEYMPGGTLKEKVGATIPWEEAVRQILPIARGLEYAHRRGIIHRDIKPANILLTDDAEPMLSDFGIAKIFGGDKATTITGSGVTVGTPEYMAPEQWTGDTGAYSDIYSLGIVLYEMVTGNKPFVADTPGGILLKQAMEPLPLPRGFVTDLPEEVESLLVKALAKEPTDRYSDMQAMIRAMEGLLTAESTTQPLKPSIPRQEPAPGRPRESGQDEGGRATLSVEGLVDARGIDDPPSEHSQEVNSKPPPGFLRKGVFIGAGVAAILLFIFAGLPFVQRMTASPPTLTPAPPTGTSSPVATSTNTQTPHPTATLQPTDVIDAKGIQMAFVSSGVFIMGNNFDANEPFQKVYLDNFYIDKYEVTNGLYTACVEAGVCEPPQRNLSHSRSDYFTNPIYKDYPVVNVDWDMARTYCEWRGARLPTEAEWEKAARGPDGLKFPWGDAPDSGCKRSRSCGGVSYPNPDTDDTVRAGQYETGRSVYGIYDLIGNVEEWVADWFSETYYQEMPDENPPGPETGNVRVLRGGHWAKGETAYWRNFSKPTSANVFIGFRCAMDATP